MHIKTIASARSVSLSDSDKSVRIRRRKKANTGGLRSNKSPRRAHEIQHGVHLYCVIFKKAGIPECKYHLHSADDFTGVCTKRSIKDGTGVPIGSRDHYVQHHKKSENKWTKDLKSLKNQNKILYSIAKKYGSRR